MKTGTQPVHLSKVAVQAANRTVQAAKVETTMDRVVQVAKVETTMDRTVEVTDSKAAIINSKEGTTITARTAITERI